jgi:hypothetical protein
MKRLSIGTLSVIGLFILACGGGSDDEGGDDEYYEDLTTDDLTAVSLTQPWSGMHLPVGDGVVVASDKSMMLIAYDNGSISGLTGSYTSAIEKAGWTKGDDYSSPDFTAIIYTKGSQEVGFACGEEEGLTFTYMEDLDGNTNSTVRAAKSGQKGIPATKAAQGKRKKKSTTKSGGSKSKSGGKKSGGKKSGKKSGKKGKKGKKKKK